LAQQHSSPAKGASPAAVSKPNWLSLALGNALSGRAFPVSANVPQGIQQGKASSRAVKFCC